MRKHILNTNIYTENLLGVVCYDPDPFIYTFGWGRQLLSD